MDERERDKFYTAPDPTADDDEEYELEPLDPTIVSPEQRHAKAVAEAVKVSIDIDEIYREAERSRSVEILENWVRNFHFRFQVKHLLVATAVLAVVLTISNLGYFWPALLILVMGSVAGLYFYLQWEERKQQAEAHQKREELYAKRRQQLLANAGGVQHEPVEALSGSVALPSNETDEIWREAATPEPFRFRFSMRSLIIAMTVAAVSLGMIRVLGGPGPTASILGLIAVAGLVIHALGIEPPQPVILGWWFILVLYVLLSIFGAVWPGVG